MPFLVGPKLDYLGGGVYATNGETVYQGERDRIVVPTGFHTDLASIPRIFWSLLPANGFYEKAAVVHDRLCVELAEGICGISSRRVDALFRGIARESAVRDRLGAWLVSWILWAGVRMGAVMNPARRGGWWRDGWLAVLIVALLAAITVAVVLGLDRLLHSVF